MEDEEENKQKRHHQLCFECLDRRIKSDFSNHLLFSYGISDSPLPFASSAVVQMSNSSGEASLASQFLLVYLRRDEQEHDCLDDYINEYVLDRNGRNDDEPNAFLDVGSNGGSRMAVDGIGFGGSMCCHAGRVSCSRIMTALYPIAHVGVCSFSLFEKIASDYLSGCLEDHVLCSLCLLIEQKASGRESLNFLSLLGIPSFDENIIPGCLRHPNIAPVLGLFKVSNDINLVLPKTSFSLENILHFSPNFLKSEWRIKFLLYQLLSALAYLHGLGASHGNIRPSSVMLTDSGWSWLCFSDKPLVGFNSNSGDSRCVVSTSSATGCCIEGCSSRALYADLKLLPRMDWHTAFHQWWQGELTNFEYLLLLNKLAGRRWGDHTFHPVMPWVIDFSSKPDENSDSGWRDLSKSKWRLAKGDEQLDFTYLTSEIPHHVSDECLSELAVCSYKARRLPLSVLRMTVRSVYEPNEYPSNMQRLYQWTPDECIPEFYCDPQVFYSIHSGMTDLTVPSWADSPEEFIKLHRDALESDRVSSQINNWIDITFGYKMSGQAAVAAKNVMLPSPELTKPKSAGRHQLFTLPHPVRHNSKRRNRGMNSSTATPHCQVNSENPLLFETGYLQELEKASSFSEHSRHLSPLYSQQEDSEIEKNSSETFKGINSNASKLGYDPVLASDIDLEYLLEHVSVEDECSTVYQEMLLWRQKSSCLRSFSREVAKDIFSIGCLLAELHFQRPLFDPISLSLYLETGALPKLVQELPPYTKEIVEACIEKDWTRRPSAKCLLESPYFPPTIMSSYLLVAPLQLIAKDGSRLRYAANFAKQGVLKTMGSFAAEMCAPYCLSLVISPLSDTEAELACILLKEFIKCLTPNAVIKLIFPTIQKILQTTGYSHLKVSLLQDSFVREIWNSTGKQAYLETIHPLVISNLYVAPHKSSASAASVLLIGSSEELGVPITVHQTVLPLIQCFGKGICTDGIDVLVRIGGLLGESFIVRQMLPLLKHVAYSCFDVSSLNKSEPVLSWSALSLIDCLTSLEGLAALLPSEVIVKELIEDQSCLHVMVLMQTNSAVTVLQVAASTLLTICQQIGPELTALHVLPRLKRLFDELAFSQETSSGCDSLGRSSKAYKPKVDLEPVIESRMDLAVLLYPSLASILGIEKLRQGCATWLLLEQFLLRRYRWKWEQTGDLARLGTENVTAKRPLINKGLTSDYSRSKQLLNGVGWSIPQSQGNRSAKNLMPQKWVQTVRQSHMEKDGSTSNLMKHEPWFWFPNPAASWDGPDFLGRVGGLKDEVPWKIRASVLSSVRAHQGAVRSLAVCQDEFTVFTAGIGLGFKGTVQKWELARINCVSGYYDHEEVVNDICLLSSSGRVASCDGTVHIWNSQTGKLLSLISEASIDPTHLASHLSHDSKINGDQASLLNSSTLSSGILSNAFDGSLYTCLHHLECRELLVVGTGSGSLRFVDVAQGRKLHLWRGESTESGFASLVSAICTCGSDNAQASGASGSPSWIASGLSSGQVRLFDVRSGNIIASWKAHDGYVTKLAAPDEYSLISSSLDRTLRIWDLRRNLPPQPVVVKGHADGISGFSVWGHDIISISRNKIGLSSLSKAADEDGQHRLIPQNLYMADHGGRNMSVLSSISILPFSRLFLVGTEDGYLRICC